MPTSSSEPFPEAADFGEQMLAKGVLHSLPSDAHFVRYITPNERDAVRRQCVVEQLRLAHESNDREASPSLDESEAQKRDRDSAEALYRCLVMYPLDPLYLRPLSDRQLRTLYDYYKETLVPCLESKGFDVGPVPSWEFFIANTNPRWDPYRQLKPVRSGLSLAEFRDLRKSCPPLPPTEDLYLND